jgi:competence protein ComEC
VARSAPALSGATAEPHATPLAVAVDLRLAPALGAGWASALVVVRLPAASGRTAALACLVVAVLVGVAGRRRGSWSCMVAFALVVAAATLGAGAAQVASRDSGPWQQLEGERVAVVGRVAGDPLVLQPAWPGAPGRAIWLLTAEEVGTTGPEPRWRRARAPLRVLGPVSGAPPFDARVRVRGRLEPEPAGQRAVAVLLTTQPVVVVGKPGSAHRLAHGVRAAEHDLAARLAGDARALLPGVTVGDTSGVPEDLRAAMRAAGLTHLTAVSGAHFSLVAMLALTIAGASGVPRRWRPGVVLVAMAAMVVLVHPSPSVVRAAAMGLVGVWGMVLGRPARAPAALAAAVVVLLVGDPWLAGELGFVLSVLATGGIVLAGGALARRWEPSFGRVVATALAVPVAAQLACGPAVVAIAPAFTTYAIPANLVAAPAVAPATVLGLVAGVVEPWCAPLAHVLACGAGAACWWIGAVARVAAHAPGATVAWLPGAAGVATLALAGLCVSRLLLVRGRA